MDLADLSSRFHPSGRAIEARLQKGKLDCGYSCLSFVFDLIEVRNGGFQGESNKKLKMSEMQSILQQHGIKSVGVRIDLTKIKTKPGIFILLIKDFHYVVSFQMAGKQYIYDPMYGIYQQSCLDISPQLSISSLYIPRRAQQVSSFSVQSHGFVSWFRLVTMRLLVLLGPLRYLKLRTAAGIKFKEVIMFKESSVPQEMEAQQMILDVIGEAPEMTEEELSTQEGGTGLITWLISQMINCSF